MAAHMTTMSESRRPFVPGMGVEWLLPVYDPFTRLLRTQSRKTELLRQAESPAGTSRARYRLWHREPDRPHEAMVPGRRGRRRGSRCQSARASHGAKPGVPGSRSGSIAVSRMRSTMMTASFDRAFSSFMFHHLERAEKERTLREVRRVLKVGRSSAIRRVRRRYRTGGPPYEREQSPWFWE